MKTYATIERRVVRILGHPNSGWSPADPDDDNALEIEFRFAITGDGNKGCLLVCQPLDDRHAADSWHATLEEAFDVAEASYGITRSEWTVPNPVP